VKELNVPETVQDPPAVRIDPLQPSFTGAGAGGDAVVPPTAVRLVDKGGIIIGRVPLFTQVNTKGCCSPAPIPGGDAGNGVVAVHVT